MKTKVFTIDKGQTKNQAIDDFTASLVSDGVSFYTTTIANNGTVYVTVGYDDSLRVLSSSPADEGSIDTTTSPMVSFNNTFNSTDESDIVPYIELYEDGALVALDAADISVLNNTINILTPVASTSLYYQVVFRTGLPSDNNKKLAADSYLTWRS